MHSVGGPPLRGVALYDFTGETEDQLIFLKGEIVTVYSQEDELGWWEGEVHGQRGFFPGTYVRILDDGHAAPLSSSDSPPRQASGSAGMSSLSLAGPASHPYTREPEPTPVDLTTFHDSSQHQPHASLLSNVYDNADYGQAEDPSLLAMSFEVGAKDSPTRVGQFASNLAYGSAVGCIVLGICTFEWGNVEDSETNNTVKDILCGVYNILVGFSIILYESNYGYYRNPMKIPVRAIAYAVLSIFCFFSMPTILAGVMLLITACANGVSAFLGETYTKDAEIEKAKSHFLGGRRMSYSTRTGSGSTLRARRVSDGYYTPNLAESLLSSEHVAGPTCWARVTRFARRTRADCQDKRYKPLFFIIIYLIANSVLFWLAYKSAVDDRNDTAPADRLSSVNPFARAFGGVLCFNCVLILFPMMKTLLRWLCNMSAALVNQSWFGRGLRAVADFLPFDRHTLHISVSFVIVLATVAHVTFAFINYVMEPTNSSRRFGVWPYVSGGGICVCMLFIYAGAFKNVRGHSFELFWYTHYFFVPFYILLLTHGAGGWNPRFWAWAIFPGFFYLIERLARLYEGHKPAVVLSVTHIRPNILAVEIEKQGIFGYSEGQNVALNCLYIARHEWQLFPISSAPQESSITVHLLVEHKYSWQRQFQTYIESISRSDSSYVTFERVENGRQMKGRIIDFKGKPILRVEGPHASPTQHIPEYNHVMVAAEGYGVCNLASTVSSIIRYRWHSYSTGQASQPERAQFFWICRWDDIDMYRWVITQLKDILDEVHDMTVKQAPVMLRRLFQFHIFVTHIPDDAESKDILLEDNVSFWGHPLSGAVDKLHLEITKEEIYRAMKNPEQHQKLGNLEIHSGRPNWDLILEQVSQHYIRDDESVSARIGVMYCGSGRTGSELNEVCSKFSHGNRSFIVHRDT